MDELTLLRGVRADTPGPTAGEAAAAYTRLQDEIGRWQRLPGRPRRRRARILAAVAAAAAIAVAASLVGVRAVHRDGWAARAHLTAVIVLQRAAAAAARQPAADGRFYVTESEGITPGNRRVAPAVRTIWLGNGRPGRLVQPAPAGVHWGPIPPGISFGGRTLTWAQLRNLPTDPHRLRARIAGVSRHRGTSLEAEEFDVVAGLLWEAPAVPALRAALYQVVAGMPGVMVVRTAHDLIGRAATEVIVPTPGDVVTPAQALFFDPSTGVVLGTASLVTTRLGCLPAWESAVLASGYVGSVHQLPPGARRHPLPVRLPRPVPGCPNPVGGTGPSSAPSPSSAASVAPSPSSAASVPVSPAATAGRGPAQRS